ncbi:prenylcysteine alpha-carboxyl methylesterase protein [Dioscorea alata]|uniref:Prenylcysteine alpha-carboxyl methylesterase protein n=3 Tax=Dioscorea alata TaxID=55571 RepID=A0ACB7TRI4_DIOAL|nr:prenylcysteine alpha-carboxyl methylesterase protein [Dioscorea alata]KAH7650987.1 prenylcysteine alpha-carboxyl methylesterase protein [Dioscorea alata]KAH7650988.1 prenylcysteine alpha-carboxyl methylesterase protein [Dioscorea alata]
MQSEIVPRGDGSSGEGSSASPGSPEETPFLRRVPSESRRRRAVSEPTLSSLSSPFAFESNSRRRSFRRDVGHAAAETFLLTRLTLILLRYLGVGYRWITRFLALACYAILLMPGFIQVGYHYFCSSQVRRSVVYGEQPRNRLDLYLPTNTDQLKPVVAFVTGGAWIIGYKAWGALLGKQLAERGIIVACIDYRNFPQGTISDMVKDASQGISFVCSKAAGYGGDPNRIYLVGQSAGAHIAACTLLDQALKESGEGEDATWSVSQIKAYFGISGGYNLLKLVDHFHSRGLYRSIFLSVMEGEESLRRYSPEVVVQDPYVRHAASLLPPIILFHGMSDYSIPCDASETFAEALRNAGVEAKLVLYKGKTHTDLFIQDPLRGGKDELLEDIISVIHAGDTVALAEDAVARPTRRLVPEFMIQLARKISPF